MAEPTFERHIKFHPAYDKRSDDPEHDYGIHGVNLSFGLEGPEGVLVLQIHTNWHLKHVQEELDERVSRQYPHLLYHPQPAGVDFHYRKDPRPGAEWPTPRIDKCKWTGGECWCDGSCTLSEGVYWILVSEGEEAMWSKLAEIYSDWKKPDMEDDDD